MLCADNYTDAMIQATINGWMCAKDIDPNFCVAMQQIAYYIF
jgi:hypothetical protein